jgi:hypothetical protein
MISRMKCGLGSGQGYMWPMWGGVHIVVRSLHHRAYHLTGSFIIYNLDLALRERDTIACSGNGPRGLSSYYFGIFKPLEFGIK